MGEIVRLIKVILLGKAILLTPNPVQLDREWLNIELEAPLKAITAGASLEIRIPRDHRLIVGSKNSNDVYEAANTVFPNGTMEARLVDSNGGVISLSHRVISISKEYVSYGLVANRRLPTDMTFEKVKVRSNVEIEGVQVVWKNYKH